MQSIAEPGPPQRDNMCSSSKPLARLTDQRALCPQLMGLLFDCQRTRLTPRFVLLRALAVGDRLLKVGGGGGGGGGGRWEGEIV